MAVRTNSDEIEGMSGDDLRAAVKKLSSRSMNFAFGFKDAKTSFLVMHPTKSAKTLGAELKAKAGAKKTAGGVARADGKALVMDVEGTPMNGMRAMVKTLLRKERVSAFTETRVLVGGVEEGGTGGTGETGEAEEAGEAGESATEDGSATAQGDDSSDVETPAVATAFLGTRGRGGDGTTGTGEGRDGVRELEEVGGQSNGGAAKGSSGKSSARSVKGSVFSRKTAEGDEADFLSGEGEIGEDGRISGKGAVAKFKKGDEEGELLSGEFQFGEDGASGKGAVAKLRKKGQTDTIGEVEFSGQKASVVGIKRETDVAEATGLLPEGAVAKGDAAIGTASADASFTDDGISVGAQANIAEGSVTLGTSGTKREDGSDSDRDETVRVGVSAGGGLAGRVHFGDADKDGNPEIGIGADFGPVSFDVKSEDPLRTAGGLLTPAGLPSVARALTDDGSNLTKETVGSPSEGLGVAREFVGGVKELLS